MHGRKNIKLFVRLQKEKYVIKNGLSDHEATVNKNRIGHDGH